MAQNDASKIPVEEAIEHVLFDIFDLKWNSTVSKLGPVLMSTSYIMTVHVVEPHTYQTWPCVACKHLNVIPLNSTML